MKSDFMLTGKDLLYLEDAMDQSSVLYKRISFIEPQIQDAELKAEFKKVKDNLKTEFERMLSIMEKEVHNG